ncbi:MAG: protein tyrosine phosphatase [Gordonia sp. (in: high G+C Gram-positive bacteria)]|nr:MAG: protein tyrosine phosphatase [Gordonia sp. (in: high G+C Gram-positive bacteria)]
MRVLFVCTGNICRSPVAQRILERYAADRDIGVYVSSAGTRAMNGAPMHPESVRVLAERGIVAGEFKSRLLTPAIASDFDLILGMTREHRAAARQLSPARWRRMYALREIVTGTPGAADGAFSTSSPVDPTDGRLDIEDPIGRPSEIFDRVAADIDEATSQLGAWIETQLARTITSKRS